MVKKKPSKDIQKNIQGLIDRLETAKQEAAKVRDTIRNIADEATDLIESFDSGIDSLTAGIIEIQHGVDKLSEYV